MTVRVVKLLPCLLVAALAGLATSEFTTARADDCAAAPGRQTASGEHWYYRIDRATKRHCWYVRAEGKTTRTAGAALPATPSASPASIETLDQSVANARAEIPAPTVSSETGLDAPPARPADTAPPLAQPATQTLARASSEPWSLAERWSNQGSSNATSSAVQPAALMAKLQSAKTADRGEHPVWMLISTIAGALMLAGLTVALISNFRRNPSVDRVADETPHMSRREPHDWQPHEHEPVVEDVASTVNSDASDLPPMNWIRIAREQAQKRGEQIEELLSASQRRHAL